MVASERPTVVIDVAARWTVDAALFFAGSVGFLAWGVLGRSAAPNILSWAIMAIVAMLFDRLHPFLSGAGAMAEARERPPAGAVRRTAARYAAGAVGAMALIGAVDAAFVVFLVPPGFFAGWMTAYGVSRLRGLVAAREIERRSGVRLSMSLHRAAWRTRTPAYYATPRTA